MCSVQFDFFFDFVKAESAHNFVLFCMNTKIWKYLVYEEKTVLRENPLVFPE